jgi:hypothetical protein
LQQSWVGNPNLGLGAGSPLSNSTSPTDISAAPQYMSQTYGQMYVGQRWRFTAYGIVSTTSTPTLNLGIYYGGIAGTALCTAGTVTMTASASSWWWRIQVEMQVRTLGSTGTVWCQGWFDNPTSATAVTRLQMSATAQTVTINTTTNSALTCGATWGTASSSNTITCEDLIIEQLN